MNFICINVTKYSNTNTELKKNKINIKILYHYNTTKPEKKTHMKLKGYVCIKTKTGKIILLYLFKSSD